LTRGWPSSTTFNDCWNRSEPDLPATSKRFKPALASDKFVDKEQAAS
jgi:hypothetical protein